MCAHALNKCVISACVSSPERLGCPHRLAHTHKTFLWRLHVHTHCSQQTLVHKLAIRRLSTCAFRSAERPSLTGLVMVVMVPRNSGGLTIRTTVSKRTKACDHFAVHGTVSVREKSISNTRIERMHEWVGGDPLSGVKPQQT